MDRKCVFCGADIPIDRNSKYCSDKCRRENDKKNKRERYVWKTERLSNCIQCGKPLKGSRTKFCSDACNSRYRAINIDKTCFDHGELTKTCKVCGKEFKTYKERKQTCSIECRKTWHEKHGSDRRYKGIPKDPDISLFKLSERDRCQCQICGMSVNWDDWKEKDGYKVSGNLYPSIDHIVPISRGGTHTWGNIQLAHRKCNSSKGIKLWKISKELTTSEQS